MNTSKEDKILENINTKEDLDNLNEEEFIKVIGATFSKLLYNNSYYLATEVKFSDLAPNKKEK